jgi:hypothetical protein
MPHRGAHSTADIGETVAGQSHAWLEWWDGEWRSWDPTNHKPAGDFHVTVARGRDYRDVPPLKGILKTAMYANAPRRDRFIHQLGMQPAPSADVVLWRMIMKYKGVEYTVVQMVDGTGWR